MKKLFTLAAAVLASFSLWANQTDLISGVTLPDMPSASLDLTTQETFTPDGNGWIVFDPYADAANLSTIPTWWTHTNKATQSQEVTADAINEMTAPFYTKNTNNFKVNFDGNISGAIRFTGATDASFLVNPRSSKVFYVGLYSINGATQTLVEEKSSTTSSAYNEILYTSLSASTEYVAYFYGKVKQNQCIAEIALKGSAPTPICPSNLTISGKKAYTEGEKIELTAALEEGNGAISYQWYKGSIAEGNKIAGATTTKLEIANCTGSNAGDYFCVASKADCEDAESAAYAVTVKTIEPTGDATVTYSLTKGSDAVSGSAIGVNSISAFSNQFARSTLTFNGNGKDNYAARSESMPAEFSEDAYYDLQFTLANGYVFTPSTVTVQVNPFSSTGAMKVKVAILDDQEKVVSNELSCQKDKDNSVEFAAGAFNDKLFEGNIHIRIYLYGASGKNCYIKSPISVAGTVAVAPTKYNVTFDANGGSGEMATLKHVEGAEVTLPACTFTAPTGKEFDAWTSEDVTISENKFTMPAKDVTISAKWKDEISRYTVVYKEDGESELGSELVEVGEHPTASEIETSKDYYTFAAWQLNEEDVALSAVEGTKGATVTLVARYEKNYASSINIEQLVLDKGTKYDIATALANNGFVAVDIDALDTLNDLENKANRNYAFLGLKVKKSTSAISLLLKSGSTLRVKFGNVGNNVNFIIGDAEPIAKTADDLKNAYEYTATADVVVKIQSTGTKTVVLKQIMIDDAIADVTLPTPEAYLVNLAEVTNGTIAVNWDDKKYRAPVGATITITATPASGYKIVRVTIDGETIEPVEDKYTFVMPAKDVTVSAIFDTATALTNTEAGAKAQKRIENGQLVIEKNGQVFNAMGQTIR